MQINMQTNTDISKRGGGQTLRTAYLIIHIGLTYVLTGGNVETEMFKCTTKNADR